MNYTPPIRELLRSRIAAMCAVSRMRSWITRLRLLFRKGCIVDLLSLRTHRRAVLKGAIALGSLNTVLNVPDASAFRGWCRSDPLITIDGTIADIFATASLRILTMVTGPNQIIISTPRDIKTHLILVGPGFGRGEKVRLETSEKLRRTDQGIEIEIRLKVPARESLPIGVEFAPRIVGILNPDRAEGVTNEWVTLSTVLKKRKPSGGGLLPIDLPLPIELPGLIGRNGERRGKRNSR